MIYWWLNLTRQVSSPLKGVLWIAWLLCHFCDLWMDSTPAFIQKKTQKKQTNKQKKIPQPKHEWFSRIIPYDSLGVKLEHRHMFQSLVTTKHGMARSSGSLTFLQRRPQPCRTDWSRSRKPESSAVQPSAGEEKRRRGKNGGRAASVSLIQTSLNLYIILIQAVLRLNVFWWDLTSSVIWPPNVTHVPVEKKREITPCCPYS